MTHTEQGTAADEQVYLFKEEGVDLSRVMLCHLDKKPEVDYHRQLLREGVTLEYDSAFRWKGRSDNPTFALLKILLPEFPNQLVIGMDAGRPAYWKHYGGRPGLEYLLTGFRRELEETGLGEKMTERLLLQNPARVLTFLL
jgi:phosphotriesterase-related protein